MDKKKLLMLLGLLAVLVHLPAVFGPFMWDDESMIKEDSYVHSLSNAGYVFTPQYWKRDFQGAESRYRPLRALTLMVDWKLWGGGAFGYHITNTLLNLIVVFLVFYLARLLLGSDEEAFIAAVFFAVHPVHVEAVAWIKNRTELLAGIFSVMFLFGFISRDKDPRPAPAVYAGVVISYLLALFSKESAAALWVVPFLYLLLIGRRSFAESVRKTAPFAALGLLLLGFALFVLRREKLSGGLELTSSLLALIQYLRLLILPIDLNAERMLVTAFDFAGPVAFAVMAYCFFYKKDRLSLFLVIWTVLAVLSVSNAGLVVGRPIAEQRLYLAVLPLAILFARFFGSGIRRRISAAVVLVVFFAFSLSRAFDWKDPVRLWEKTVRQSPYSARAHSNLGVAYEMSGRMDEAAREYRKAIGLDPEGFTAYGNLGAAMLRSGLRKEAEEVYWMSVKKSPASVQPKLDLARALIEQGRLAEAGKLAEEVVVADERSASAYDMMGLIAMVSGKEKDAFENYSKALALAPRLEDALYNLAVLSQTRGDIQAALGYYAKLLRLSPDHADALNNTAILYDMTGRREEAVELFKKVVKASPKYFQAHYNLGNIYFEKGLYLEALSEFKSSLDINPGHEKSREKADKARRILEGHAEK